jgi:acyl carrier protein
MREHVIASLKRLFGDRGVDIDSITDDSEDLIDRLEWDSMDAVDMGLEFERRHDVVLPREARDFNTINKILSFFPAK